MRNRIKELTALFAPSGYEDAVRSYLRTKISGVHAEVWEDALGNLFVHKKGRKTPESPIVMAAYMDEPGLMVKGITEEGLIRFGLVGNTDPGSILGKQVLVGEQKLHGVVGMKPIHLTTEEERKSLPKVKELYIDTGAETASELKDMVDKGDYGVFYGEACPVGRQLFGKAMGRSVTCAVLLELLEQELPVDVTFAFTSQRQVGSRGAYGAGYSLKAGTVIVLDLCPGCDSGDELPVLGGGPVAPAMDRDTMFAPELMKKLRNCGEVQNCGKVSVSGDGAAFQKAGEGARVSGLCCPAKYLSAPCQMIDLSDAVKMTGVLMEFLKGMEEDLL